MSVKILKRNKSYVLNINNYKYLNIYCEYIKYILQIYCILLLNKDPHNIPLVCLITKKMN